MNNNANNNGRLKMISIIVSFCVLFSGIVASWATQRNELNHQCAAFQEQKQEQKRINEKQDERTRELEKNWVAVVTNQKMIIEELKKINDKLDKYDGK